MAEEKVIDFCEGDRIELNTVPWSVRSHPFRFMSGSPI